ncbi:hypothetical protein [Cellulomonas sp. URHE0023]|uniref:hypothetical protein n=1 Tax=Cellulomonas sp. URHE0023 TaxID=1380354 RepID=UPI0005530A16|nr:hypothetical protein [Cellulomonas sp. URHE0023]
MIQAVVDPYNQTEPAAGLAFGLIAVMVLFYAALIAFGVYCYVRIARKAGYSGWYAALCFVPVANLVVMIMFVFKEWPIEAELRLLRSAQGPYGGGYPPVAAPAAYGTTPYTSRFEQPAPWGQAPQQTQGYPPVDGGPQAPGTPETPRW